MTPDELYAIIRELIRAVGAVRLYIGEGPKAFLGYGGVCKKIAKLLKGEGEKEAFLRLVLSPVGTVLEEMPRTLKGAMTPTKQPSYEELIRSKLDSI